MEAGIILQVDDAWLPALWDHIGIQMGLEAFQRRCQVHVEALNYALRGIPEDRGRYHLCWGSWHGVVTHSTGIVEHPELVAQRIRRFAALVGKENVIAGADCGFGGRTHPQIAWAKLRSLVEGSRLASEAMW